MLLIHLYIYQLVRYMDLEGPYITYIRSMNVGGHRHYYESFYEKSTYQISINRGRTTTTQGAHESLVRILSFLLFFSWERALKKISKNLEIV